MNDLSESQFHLALTNCEREQIHIPGLIQPFGILLCLDEAKLTIERVSRNIEWELGRPVETLLNSPLSTLVPIRQFEKFRTEIRKKELDKSELISLELKSANGLVESWEGKFHRVPGSLILELERKEGSSAEAGGVFRQAESCLSEIQSSSTLKALSESAVREIQRLTGYDRVMLYRFDPEWNGEVVAEARSGSGVETYLAHRFPASDIPAQARAVFLSNWLRMIPDVEYKPEPVVPTLHPRTGLPLDLSRSLLRSVSPIHLQYLRNMKVKATLTISLIRDGRLYGLIACHHGRERRISAEVRSACRFLGKLVSSMIPVTETSEAREESERLQSVQESLVKSMIREQDVVLGLINYSPNLLDLLRATGAAASSQEEPGWTTIGKTPDRPQLDRLLDWLKVQMNESGTQVFQSDFLSGCFPEAETYSELGSGLLAIAIPKGDRNFILWFRPEVLQSIIWAGNPDKSVFRLPDGSLKIEPRSSFESWKETVRRRSLPWRTFDLKAALDLKNAILAFDLERQFFKEQEARTLAERLGREKEELLAAVSHDLKNPLYSIQLAVGLLGRKYLMKEGAPSVDPGQVIEDIRKAHEKVLSSAKRMDRLINDLLEVAKIESGKLPLHRKRENVSTLIAGAVSSAELLAQQKGVRLEAQVADPDCWLIMDEDRISQVLSNLIGNALKFTAKDGSVVLAVESAGGEVVISVRDSGVGIPAAQLPHVFDRFWQARETNRMGSGLGLAICKGIVEAHGGRIWIESEFGKGTKVCFVLPVGGELDDDAAR